MTTMANRVSSFGTTIFSEINSLALKHDAVNLGQGKPNFDGPQEVIAAAQQALEDGRRNQYAPGYGIYSLRQAIAEHEKRFYRLELDPDSQITVTVGATEGVYASVMGLVDPGDEVIVFEPFYDSYIPAIKMAGATPRYCPLHPPTWHFDPDELRALFNENTRALIINTPHNPTGKIYTDEELSLIADLCKEFDVTVISDEVYEHIIFDDIPHKSLISLPDMFERTVKVSSVGKSFSVTGWKIGWVTGSTELITGVQRARQFISFAVAHPLQVGAAHALRMDDEYYESLIKLYQGKRDLLVKLLNDAGLKAATPQGSYFVMADFSAVFDGNDVEFAKWLIQDIGVACIPPTFFYSEPNKHIVSKQARFAFCKTDDVLHAAAEKLARMGG